MKRSSIVLLILFIADFIFDVVIAGSGNGPLRYLAKGLLMPLLLVYFLTQTQGHVNGNNRTYVKLVCGALVFSFLGDILLIGESDLNFMLGIAAFLVAQVFYITLFYRLKSFSKKNAVFLFIATLVILAYLFILNYLFLPKVQSGHFTIPVLAYSMVLGLMLLTSVNLITSGQLFNASIFYFIPGAISFIASDSMLGFNRFYLSSPLPDYYIMTTYCLAQFLIVSGVIRLWRD